MRESCNAQDRGRFQEAVMDSVKEQSSRFEDRLRTIVANLSGRQRPKLDHLPDAGTRLLFDLFDTL